MSLLSPLDCFWLYGDERLATYVERPNAEEEQKMQIDLRRLGLKTDKVAGRDLSVGS